METAMAWAMHTSYADTQNRADFLSKREYQHDLLLVKLAVGASIPTVGKQIFTVPKRLMGHTCIIR